MLRFGSIFRFRFDSAHHIMDIKIKMRNDQLTIDTILKNNKLNSNKNQHCFCNIESPTDQLIARYNKNTYTHQEDRETDNLRHSFWHLRRQTSFQFGTWCWLTQTVRAQASAQASTSEAPHTVTQVSVIGSLENDPTFFSILFDVQTLSHTKISSAPFSLPRALLIRCSSACFVLILRA